MHARNGVVMLMHDEMTAVWVAIPLIEVYEVRDG